MSTDLPITQNDRETPVYSATAGQTAFTVDFPFQEPEDLRVALVDTSTPPVETTVFVLNTHYTVTGAGSPGGGAVTFLAGRTAGDRIRITGDAAVARTTAITQNGKFRSVAYEYWLDRVTIWSQERKRDLGKVITSVALAVASASAAAASEAAAEVARLAAENAAGGVTQYHYATKAHVEAATIPAPQAYINIAGHISAGDGGAAQYVRAGSEPSHTGKIQSDDGAWWELSKNQRGRAEMFGARGDGVTNDATAIMAALAYFRDVQLFGKVYAASTVTMDQDGMHLSGPMTGTDVFGGSIVTAARLLYTGTAGGLLVDLGSPTVDTDMLGGGLSNVRLNGNLAAGTVLRMRAIRNPHIRSVKIEYPQSGGIGWYLSTLSSDSATNTIYSGLIDDVSVVVTGNALGIYNDKLAPGNGQNTTFCNFGNVHVTHEDGAAVTITAMDDCVFSYLGTSRLAGGTGNALVISATTNYVVGNRFLLFHAGYADGSAPGLLVAGGKAYQNDFVISGVDGLPAITMADGNWYRVLGTGYDDVNPSNGAIDHIPPARIQGRRIDDDQTLDIFKERQADGTLAVTIGGSSTGIAYSTRSYKTQRVGDWVHGWARVDLTSKGAGSGAVKITGLPYSADNAYPCSSVTAYNLQSGQVTGPVMGSISTDAAISLFKAGATGVEQLLAADITNSTIFIISFAYHTQSATL